jgi:hypothetical protein
VSRLGAVLAWMFACAIVVTANTADAQNSPASPAKVQETSATVTNSAPQPRGTQGVRKPAKPYFVEFRARAAQSYGHTFLVHGRVGQKITAKDVVGLHPATESPVPWMIGHFVLVPSETGSSDGDVEDQYIIAKYRVPLTEAEYKRVAAYMKERQANSPVWHAVFYNCNAFVADIAKFMGLKTPSSSLVMPKDFIDEMKGLNTGSRAVAASTSRVQ